MVLIKKGAGNYPPLIDISKKYTRSAILLIINYRKKNDACITAIALKQRRKAIASFILKNEKLQKENICSAWFVHLMNGIKCPFKQLAIINF
jgi:hypothetical protein